MDHVGKLRIGKCLTRNVIIQIRIRSCYIGIIREEIGLVAFRLQQNRIPLGLVPGHPARFRDNMTEILVSERDIQDVILILHFHLVRIFLAVCCPVGIVHGTVSGSGLCPGADLRLRHEFQLVLPVKDLL